MNTKLSHITATFSACAIIGAALITGANPVFALGQSQAQGSPSQNAPPSAGTPTKPPGNPPKTPPVTPPVKPPVKPPAPVDPGAQIVDLRVYDGFKYSLELFWKRSANDKTTTSYLVEWGMCTCKHDDQDVVDARREQMDHDGHADVKSSRWVTAAYNGHHPAVQIQGLLPMECYDISITPVDTMGVQGKRAKVRCVKPKGTYEKSLLDLTNGDTKGFIYQGDLDTVHSRPNPQKIHTNNYNMNAIGDRMVGGRSQHSFASVLPTQQHWHIGGSDDGNPGSITTRFQQPMIMDGGVRKLRFDVDSGPDGRSLWYLVLSPHKLDTLPLTPNSDTSSVLPKSFPSEMIMVRVGNDIAGIRAYKTVGDVMRKAYVWKDFNWRGATYPNLRQQLGLNITANSISFLSDAGNNGQLVSRFTSPVDMVGWPRVYVYLTLGTYNNSKMNAVAGLSPSGDFVSQHFMEMLHIGNVAWDGPRATEPVKEALPHSEFDMMPNHTWLAERAIPAVAIRYPNAVLKGKANIILGAWSAPCNIVGSSIPVTRVWVELDGKEIAGWDLGAGTLQFWQSFSLDTTMYSNGEHTFVVKAKTAAGAIGYNNGESMTNYIKERRLIIKN